MRLLALLVAAALALVPAPPAGAADQIRVTDGDTIRIGDERIRIMGIDAAEMNCRCARECRLARKATDRLRELLAVGYVAIERKGRDRYRRTLAIVRVGGRDVGEVMIAEGLVRRYNGRTKRAPWC